MTQYNSLNVKLSNSQSNKLKSAIETETEAVLRLAPNMVGGSNDKTNFPHEILLTDRQVFSICISIRLLLIIQQPILHFRRLNYQKRYNQG